MKNDGLSLFGIKKYMNKSHSGFTIVELLVVIVIIGILAAISIVSYTGFTKRAAVVTLKSDLKNSSTQLALYNTTNSIYPADLAAATTERTLPVSSGTIYQYTLTNGSYCLSATSPKAGNSAYHISSLVGTIEDGVCSGHNEPGAVNIELLIVAGGGGGGASGGSWCGGGGAGGLLYVNSLSISVGAHPVIVGGGGGGGNSINGQNSSFEGHVAIGGGGGGNFSNGANGGSGGGRATGGYISGLGVVGQGHNGANANNGGGGGAGADGNYITGGIGLEFDISGTPTYYGGGGGGVSYQGDYSTGGLGGGGSMENPPGIPNTGGGGGAATYSTAGIGGSGIVIIRYLTGATSATGGTVTTSGSYTIHTFTASGTFTVN